MTRIGTIALNSFCEFEMKKTKKTRTNNYEEAENINNDKERYCPSI